MTVSLKKTLVSFDKLFFLTLDSAFYKATQWMCVWLSNLSFCIYSTHHLPAWSLLSPIIILWLSTPITNPFEKDWHKINSYSCSCIKLQFVRCDLFWELFFYLQQSYCGRRHSFAVSKIFIKIKFKFPDFYYYQYLCVFSLSLSLSSPPPHLSYFYSSPPDFSVSVSPLISFLSPLFLSLHHSDSGIQGHPSLLFFTCSKRSLACWQHRSDIPSMMEDAAARFAFPDFSQSQTPSLSLKGAAIRTWFGVPFAGRDKWARLQCKLSWISLTNGQIVDITHKAVI